MQKQIVRSHHVGAGGSSAEGDGDGGETREARMRRVLSGNARAFHDACERRTCCPRTGRLQQEGAACARLGDCR